MATESALLFREETQARLSLKQPPAISPEILTGIYTAHYRHVLQICRGFFRQQEDAEDAAAEVFLKLYRVLHQKDETIPFRPWVSKVAGHHCIDKLRKKMREKSLSLEDVDVSGFADRSTPSPLTEILRKDEQQRIREHLTRLPERHKVALVLRYYKRMSYSEIASALNMRLPTVRVMIYRARMYLKRNLRRAEGSGSIATFSKIN